MFLHVPCTLFHDRAFTVDIYTQRQLYLRVYRCITFWCPSPRIRKIDGLNKLHVVLLCLLRAGQTTLTIVLRKFKLASISKPLSHYHILIIPLYNLVNLNLESLVLWKRVLLKVAGESYLVSRVTCYIEIHNMVNKTIKFILPFNSLTMLHAKIIETW